MSTDALAMGARRRPWLRLVALSIGFVLVCFAAWRMLHPKTVTATALFEVRKDPPSIVGKGSGRSLSKEEFEILKKTQIALLKSKFVLTAALVDPSISSLPILSASNDKEAWLQDHLVIEYHQDGEILSISLRGTQAQKDDL